MNTTYTVKHIQKGLTLLSQVQPRIRQFLKPDVAEMTTDDQAGPFLGRD